VHFASDLCDPDFAKELTAERLVDPDEEARTSISRRARRLINPKAGRVWKKIVGRTNDWFDATVYAFALGWHLQSKRRLNADRWADLLLAVHGAPAEEGDLFAAAEENPFTAQPSKPKGPARPRQRKKWGSYS
jgi:phage terminase large subunit GpA-like protein